MRVISPKIPDTITIKSILLPEEANNIEKFLKRFFSATHNINYFLLSFSRLLLPTPRLLQKKILVLKKPYLKFEFIFLRVTIFFTENQLFLSCLLRSL